jgi:DNA sulfur modification protein DndB
VADTPNLPPGEDEHLTTIQNLYDVLTILFSKVIQKKSVKDLSYNRPSDAELDRYEKHATGYFEKLAKAFPELKVFFDAADPAAVVRKHRRGNGGSVLFRPAGLTMFAHIAESLIRRNSLEQAIALMGKLPRELSKPPYTGLLWDPPSGTMNLKRQVLVRRILLYMLGSKVGRMSATTLKADIAKATGAPPATITLPAQVA